MKNREMTRGVYRLLKASLFGLMTLSFGGVALAADAPVVSRLKFIDTKGTDSPSDDSVVSMRTGDSAYRVAVDMTGNVFVTDPAENTAYKYNTNGHLVAAYKIKIPRGVAVDSAGDTYVAGALNNNYAVFVLDKSGTIKGTVGASGKVAMDMDVDSNGYLYIIDSSGSNVGVINKEGQSIGGFGHYVQTFINDQAPVPYKARTRHKLISASGLAVNSSNNEVYVTFTEYVDYLSNTTCSDYKDDPNAYLLYNNTEIVTDSTYRYWCPDAIRSVIAVIDKTSGEVKNKIQIDPYVASTYTSDGSELNPQGLALDSNGRLYVGTTAGIKVYDAASGTPLSPGGDGFATGFVMDLTFDAVTGRLFATSGRDLIAYGIDGGASPANTAPSAPVTVGPASVYTSSAPVLEIFNSTDKEADPLTYGYQIVDVNGVEKASGSGINPDSNGKTDISVPGGLLSENTLYRWRAQSFDGNAISWSHADVLAGMMSWPTFCVNERNDNPLAPQGLATTPERVDAVTGYVAASPFSSNLTWDQSTDPDCYDTVSSYVVEISSDQAFGSVVGSVSVSGTSAKVGDLSKDLSNGKVYHWRVQAVDNNGGRSEYSAGSFAYKTTVVRFDSAQAGTKVYIDGNYGYLGRLVNGKYDESGNLTGILPLPLDVEGINPGSHFVTFVKAGYEPYHAIINVNDPLLDDAVVVASATSDKWVKSSRIMISSLGSELLKISGGAAPFVVDFDNDGLKDVVAGGKDGKVYIYKTEKQADGSIVLTAKGALQADGADINVGSRAVPFVVDYNNDGRKDLLIGSGEGLIYLYINNGVDSAPVFALTGTLKNSAGKDVDAGANSAPVIVDYNNDGRKDLVLGDFDGRVRLYLNKATGKGADATPKFDEPIFLGDENGDINIGNSMPFFTDWNGDGKKDMVVGGDTLHLYMNIGTDEAPDFRSASGLQDWMIAKRRERGNREFISYLGCERDLVDLAGADGYSAPFILDWDGSTAKDVIVGNGIGSVVLYRAQ